MQAKDLAAYLAPWLEEFIAAHPFVTGAYLAGSAAEKAPEDEIAGCSDIDVMLTIEGEARPKPGKIPHGGFVIEGTYIPWAQIADPEAALADYHIAHGLFRSRILCDADGRLTALCEKVRAEFSKPDRILQRVDGVIAKIENGLNGFDPQLPLHNRFMGLAFSAGIMAHAVLVAAQKNPTVRMRYRAAHEILAPEMQEFLLKTAGFADITPDEARIYALKMGELFDLVSPRCKTVYPFTGDLQPEMKKSAVDDALALIDQGLHRETMFWTCATFCRLMMQAAADAPQIHAQWTSAFEALSRRIGICTPEQQSARIALIRAALPGLRRLSESIIAENNYA